MAGEREGGRAGGQCARHDSRVAGTHHGMIKSWDDENDFVPVLRQSAEKQLRSKRLALSYLKLLAGNDLEALDDNVDKRVSHNIGGVRLVFYRRDAQPEEPAQQCQRLSKEQKARGVAWLIKGMA